MKNIENINQMSVQELANFLCEGVSCPDCIVNKSGMCEYGESCSESWEKWLESEVAE